MLSNVKGVGHKVWQSSAYSPALYSLNRCIFLQKSKFYTAPYLQRCDSDVQGHCQQKPTTFLVLSHTHGCATPFPESRRSSSTNVLTGGLQPRTTKETISAYCRLMRFHAITPVLIFCYPAMWSTFMALPDPFGMEEVKKMGLFCLGAFFARTAGCCINDMADRKIDKHVERTKTRPLAAGLVSTKEAVAIMGVNAALALSVLLQFDLTTVRLGILTAFASCCYPFMKRYTNFPQLFLGLASNLSVFITWSAIMQSLTISPVFLYLAGTLWTVIYDTVYAHQDKKFDKLIGVKSMALYWGDNTKKYCQVTAVGISLLLAAAGYSANLNDYFYGMLALSHLWMYRKIKLVDLNDPASCFKFFKRSVVYGALVLGGVVAGKGLSFQVQS